MGKTNHPDVDVSLNAVVCDQSAAKPIWPEGTITVLFDVRYRSRFVQVPITLGIGQYDDAKLVAIARSELHDLAVQLSKATDGWSLSPEELAVEQL